MVNLVAADDRSLTVVRDLPNRVCVNPDLRIPLADGAWLHGRLWFPEGAEENPVPAVVEYAPFRHRDFTAPRDALIHPWFAGHGYASLRLELRGSGDSGGMPMDEYVRQEQDDALAALEWIAEQPWCNGNTGLFGMSWGAFSALQVAARQPPSLKAIIPVHGTDDRFADDIHYKGGCLLTAGLSWGTLYTLYMMRPPDPDISGPCWRDIWLERFARAPMVLEPWMTHQYKDDYWRHGSIAENPAAVRCPALVVCGWADGYTVAALRMAEHLNPESRFWIGPWAHTYPHLARPGPQAGFLQQAVRWWDRWLKGKDSGVESWPRVRCYVQQSVAPATSYDVRTGHWIGVDHWPPPATDSHWYCEPDRLTETRRSGSGEVILSIGTPLANSIAGPEWLPHGVGPELPPEQSEEDAGALCFDTDPLGQEQVICGTPVLHLRCRVDNAGMIYVRLVDCRPDGDSLQVTYGLLNLYHREDLTKPRELPLKQWFDVSIPLDSIAQRIPAGHRIRLAIATQAWPLVWPASRAMTLEVDAAATFLSLPTLSPEDTHRLTIDSPESPAVPLPLELTWLDPVRRRRTARRDVSLGLAERCYIKDDGRYRIGEHGMEVSARGSLIYRSLGEDPLSAEADFCYRIRHARGAWNVGVECEVQVCSTAEAFIVSGEYRALEEGTVVLHRQVNHRIRRHWV